MDDIITLIVIVIAVVSAVSKIKSQQKEKSGPKPAAGSELGTKLKAFFAEVQRSFEEQKTKAPSGASRWEQLQSAGRTEETPARNYELTLEDLELEEEQPPPAPVKKPPVRPARARPRPAAGQPVHSAPAACKSEPLDQKAAPCPEFLRRAVVWSEILGPPVALRDTPWER